MTTTTRTYTVVIAIFGFLISIGAFLEIADIGFSNPVPKRFEMDADTGGGDDNNNDHESSALDVVEKPQFDSPVIKGRSENSTKQPASIEDKLDSIAALADNVDPRATLILRSYLDDPDFRIREEAVESLAAIGASESIAGLGYALSDPETSVRQLAMELLAELGTEDAIYSLTLALSDTDADSRLLAVEEISLINSVAATTVLQSFLSDEDHRVRLAANEAYFRTAEN